MTSLQPKKTPGVSQVGVEDEGDVVVGSLHPPKYPLEVHVVELVDDVAVAVGSNELLLLVVVSSLHPNHPGVLQVCVNVSIIIEI